jgi:hypothetical protein
MRALVLTLALLAGLKIWAQDSVYRAATEEALVAAYRDRAISSCQRAPVKAELDRPINRATPNWASPSNIKVVIGKSSVPVYIWEVDHELWNARYRNPYLELSANGTERLVCNYDIGHGTAEINAI